MNSIFNPFSIEVSLEDDYIDSESVSLRLEDHCEVSGDSGNENERKRGTGKKYELFKTYSSYNEAIEAMDSEPMLALDSNWVKGKLV